MSDEDSGATPQPIGLQKRAVQIVTGSICVTVSSDIDDLNRVKKIAVELADKYDKTDDKKGCE